MSWFIWFLVFWCGMIFFGRLKGAAFLKKGFGTLLVFVGSSFWIILFISIILARGKHG